MTSHTRDTPLGIQFLGWTSKKLRRVDHRTWHQAGVLGLTYLAYTCYHLTRKPISVVKIALSYNCTGNNTLTNDTWCGWAPFGNISYIILNI